MGRRSGEFGQQKTPEYKDTWMLLTLVDVGQHTTLGDSDMTQELVQLFIVADGELKVTGNNTRLLVVTSSVACQLKNFRSEVFKDGSEVNRSTYSMLMLKQMGYENE